MAVPVYWILGIIVVSSTFISLAVGGEAVEGFGDLEAPSSFIDYIVFGKDLIVALSKLVFSAITWDFVPGLPDVARIPLTTVTGVIVVWAFIRDVVPRIPGL